MARSAPRPQGVAGSSALAAAGAARRGRRRRKAVAVFALVASAGAGTSAVSSGGAAAVAWLATAAVLLVLAGCLARWPSDPERWRRGAAGEQVTAALLASSLGRRWVVLHDRRIPGSRANLDHVVVGPTGVWLIDTKTTRAVVRARWRSVRFGNRRLDLGPLAWEASVLAERLGVAVRPLVVVHQCGPPPGRQGLRRRGWRGLRRRGWRVSGIPVIPAERMVARLRRRSRRWRLRRAEVEALAARCDALFPRATGVTGPPGPLCNDLQRS